MADPTKRSGTVLKTRAGLFQPFVTLADGTRKRLPPFPKGTSEAMARERTAALQERIDRDGLVARPKPKRRRVAPVDPNAPWVTLWLAMRARRGLTAVRENESHWRMHIEPVLGVKHIKAWTPEDLRALVTSLDGKIEAGALSWKTARNVWATATRMCRDAVNAKDDAVRVRSDNPALGLEGPERGATRGRQFLYPAEALAFVGCAEVPLLWRVVLAVACYTYLRAGELKELRWTDVDLEHGILHVRRARSRVTGDAKSTKGRRVRDVPIELALRPLLEAWRQHTGDGERVFPDLPSDRDLARGLRRWLKRAGVDRPLYQDAHVNAIRFHDLRATGITWQAVRGDSAALIRARAGHEDQTTSDQYVRLVEDLRGGFGAPFPALPESLLEALSCSRSCSQGDDLAQKLRGGRDLNPTSVEKPREKGTFVNNQALSSGGLRGPKCPKARRRAGCEQLWRALPDPVLRVPRSAARVQRLSDLRGAA